MAKPFKNLMDRMSPERRERIEEQAEEILLEIALQEWQQAAPQSANASVEVMWPKESLDMRISALHRILSAMGGQLKIIAQFPDSQVVINQFDYLETTHA